MTTTISMLAIDLTKGSFEDRCAAASALYHPRDRSRHSRRRRGVRTGSRYLRQRGRNFAAWLGLVPRQRSTGGKARLGSVSKLLQTDIRRLLIIGAMSVIRWVVRKGGSTNRWLVALVARKPKMVVAVALANKMARMIWTMTTKQENYRKA